MYLICKSLGGLTSKIHAVTDGNGNVMHFIVTDCSVHDCTQAHELLEPVIHADSLVLGDRAFDNDKIINYITSKFVPSKKNRKVCRDYNRTVYKKRNQIERFLNRLKQFRRISTRYDKLEASFLPHTDAA